MQNLRILLSTHQQTMSHILWPRSLVGVGLPLALHRCAPHPRTAVPKHHHHSHSTVAQAARRISRSSPAAQSLEVGQLCCAWLPAALCGCVRFQIAAADDAWSELTMHHHAGDT